MVYSVNPHGFFAQAGPLKLFVSSHVRPRRPGCALHLPTSLTWPHR